MFSIKYHNAQFSGKLFCRNFIFINDAWERAWDEHLHTEALLTLMIHYTRTFIDVSGGDRLFSVV